MSSITSVLPKPKQTSSEVPQTQEPDQEDFSYLTAEEDHTQRNVEIRPETAGALAIRTNEEGKINYDALALRGHAKGRTVQSSFKDLIPLRQRLGQDEVSLSRPDAETVQTVAEKTRSAIEGIIESKLTANNPKAAVHAVNKKNNPQYVRYTPSNVTPGNTGSQRIIKIVDVQQDPMAPPKFKHTKVPRGPPSPPAPVLHSPTRRVTHEEQKAWYIPPVVSNYRNTKGFTIELDKRIAATGRNAVEDVQLNDRHAEYAQALAEAERKAREEIRQRRVLQEQMARKEEENNEERLRELVQRAHAEATRGGRSGRGAERSRERSRDRSPADPEEDAAYRERERRRAERRKEIDREIRMGKMNAETRVKYLAKKEHRDISEKVALNIAKPTGLTGEDAYDARLFANSGSGAPRINEDQVYDRPLFAAQEALHSIFMPKSSGAFDDDADETLDRMTREKRFEGLGASGGKAAARGGPVEFAKAKEEDPFGVNQMISDIKKQTEGPQEE